jgi:hypothetical protein
MKKQPPAKKGTKTAINDQTIQEIYQVLELAPAKFSPVAHPAIWAMSRPKDRPQIRLSNTTD